MGLKKMMELLQEKNKKEIVICKIGSFYISIGKDAILLNKILNLKLTCFSLEVCKVGFPINSLEKYTEKIEKYDYSYIVYDYNNEKIELNIVKQYKGKNKNLEKMEHSNCYICSKGVEKYRKTDKYIEAIAKLYEKEEKEYERNKGE